MCSRESDYSNIFPLLIQAVNLYAIGLLLLIGIAMTKLNRWVSVIPADTLVSLPFGV
jgi:hypothetical protein